MDERPRQLAHLEYLGDATQFSVQIHALIPHCLLLENFSPAEVRLLSHFMGVYRAQAGAEIIREGDTGDFMLMLIEGKVEVMKRDRWNTPQLIAASTAAISCGVFQRSRFITSTLPSISISMKSPVSPSRMISAPACAR